MLTTQLNNGLWQVVILNRWGLLGFMHFAFKYITHLQVLKFVDHWELDHILLQFIISNLALYVQAYR